MNLKKPNEHSEDLIVTANLSQKARKYLKDLKFKNPDKDTEAAEIIWLHTLAIGYSPAYQSENSDGLKIDWPRIPLPADKKTLKKSAELGAQLRDLLDMDMKKSLNLPTEIENQLKVLAEPKGDMQNLAIDNIWGHRDNKGKVYPGRGWVESTTQTTKNSLGLPLNIHLNKNAYWQNVPTKAWEYRIGGFQVAKKWLSYRAEKVLGRSLKSEEVRTFAEIVRRICTILLLEQELDKNYHINAKCVKEQ